MVNFCVFLIIFTSVLGFHVDAAQFKLRAREHVETHVLQSATLKTEYKGLSNTINAWWEEPYSYAIGLSYSPVLANLKFTDNSFYGTKIKIETIGIEGKWFPHAILGNSFLRLGAGSVQFKPGSSEKNQSGSFSYYGVGYEFKFSTWGLALEIAQRSSRLSEGLKIESFTPSVGVHLYDKF